MKKVLAIAALTIFLLCAGCAHTQTSIPELFNDEHDLRNVDWGMTMEEVRAAETGEPSYQSDDMLDYSLPSLFDTWPDVSLTYLFDENGICKCAMFDTNGERFEEDNDPDECVAQFDDAKESLTKVFGEPYSDSDTSEYHSLMWKTEKTYVCLALYRDDIGYARDVDLYVAPRAE